jgi:hypothetical protein
MNEATSSLTRAGREACCLHRQVIGSCHAPHGQFLRLTLFQEETDGPASPHKLIFPQINVCYQTYPITFNVDCSK